MRVTSLATGLALLAGCTAGPRAAMFEPAGASPVELLTPETDPFLEVPLRPLKAPDLPKLGAISSAARQHMWRAANSIGPAPKSLPSSIPLVDTRKTPVTEAIGAAPSGKAVEARPTSKLKGDGLRGFVQLLPPPPDDAEGSAAAPRESRYFELPPPPENE
jgi:hypothetical protein